MSRKKQKLQELYRLTAQTLMASVGWHPPAKDAADALDPAAIIAHEDKLVAIESRFIGRPKAQPNPKRSYMTPPELAEQLGISEDKVLGWIASGELRALNAAQNANSRRPRWRISKDEIKRFVASRTSQPSVPKPTQNRRRSKRRGRDWF